MLAGTGSVQEMWRLLFISPSLKDLQQQHQQQLQLLPLRKPAPPWRPTRPARYRGGLLHSSTSTTFPSAAMAELNRQLQEYLAQSKSGAKTISQSSSSTTINMDEEPASVPGSWFGSWSSPFSSRGSSAGPAQSSGFSWPWSAEPDPCLPAMSRSQRLVAFGICALLSALCFGLAALYAPLLLLKARKFALLWSLGSLFALLGAAVLRGPSKLLGSPSPGAAVYLCALAGTLYAAMGLHSTALTALGALVQIGAIAGQVVALLPGGSAGMRFVGGMAASAIKRTVTGKTMPI